VVDAGRRHWRPEGASVERGLGVQGAMIILGEARGDETLRPLCVLGGLDGLPVGISVPWEASPP
jgi:hypothetical protein